MPNVTSRCPLNRLSSSAQAAQTTVFSVQPARMASARSRSVVPAGRTVSMVREPTSAPPPVSRMPSGVGPVQSRSAPVQNRSAADWSRPAHQTAKSRNGGRSGKVAVRPSAPAR